jgi:hypothetical protein
MDLSSDWVYSQQLDTIFGALYNNPTSKEDGQMFRHFITSPKIIIVILIAQLIPLVLFPPSVFQPTNQEWWLPAILAFLTLIAIVELLVHRTSMVKWAWDLISFSQGFNLISRMLLLFPHLTVNVNGVWTFNALYTILTVLTMLISVFILWYIELPEVKNGLLKGEGISFSGK